jgi:hypothetical protein
LLALQRLHYYCHRADDAASMVSFAVATTMKQPLSGRPDRLSHACTFYLDLLLYLAR